MIGYLIFSAVYLCLSMKRIDVAVFFSGFTAVIAQTLIIREGLSLFGGNELVSGILLCFWLVCAGVGSLIFSALCRRTKAELIYARLLFTLAFFIFYSITFIRFAPRLFSLPFGEIIGLGKVMLISIITLAPTCMVFGALFPAASRLIVPERVYLVEAFGSFSGGILVSFIFVQLMPPYGILILSVSLLLICGLVILRRERLLFIPISILFLFIQIDNIEKFFRKQQMQNQNLIGLRQSRYGVIAVTKSEAQVNFYVNGVYDFAFPDPYTSEEAVHYPLLLHPGPRRILLVGGGEGGCIAEIFKHPTVEKVTYLELDPLLFQMGKRYTKQDLGRFKGLETVFGDARFFIKNTKERYDVVIINLPDPTNAQLNRFYTQEFFQEVKRVLLPSGIFSIRITTPPNIISPLFAQLLKTIKRTLEKSFSYVLALPSSKSTFISGDREIPPSGVVDILRERIAERRLNLIYVNDYFFDYNLSDEKLAYLESSIEESKGYLNTDLKPVCYYFTSVLWGGIGSIYVKKLFIKFFNFNPFLFFIPLLLLFLFYRKRLIVYASIFSMGASEIAAEIVLIILFQVFYGYLYGWIGAIIAFYMLGLGLGTIYYLHSPMKKGNLIITLARVEFITALYFGVIIIISRFNVPGINVFIAVLIFLGGFLGGLHFPLSVGILEKKSAGLIYGIDLIGSSLGALITAVLFIPILGIINTLLIFLLLNVLVGIGLRIIK